MELKVICKRLITPELDGSITEGEYGADVVGITVPRFYGEHDLSLFSFRLTSVSEDNQAVAEQILEMDSVEEETIHLLWNVTSDFTAADGEFTLILAGVNGDNTVQIKFTSQPVTINSDSRLEFLESATILEQVYNQVQLEVQKAIDAAERAENSASGTAIGVADEENIGGIKAGGDISVDENGNVTVNSVNGKTLGASVPENAVFTDTVYTLPKATETTLGGVMADGTTITVDENGVISAVGGTDSDGNFVLPKATETTLGGVMADGTTITVDENGVISAVGGTDSDGNFVLPKATETTLGGVKVDGTTVTVDENGVISAVAASEEHTHEITEINGLEKAFAEKAEAQHSHTKSEITDFPEVLPADGGNAETVNGHTVNADVPENAVFTDTVYTLPTASTTELGGVKVDGTTVIIDENGVISTAGGGAGPTETIYMGIQKGTYETNGTVTIKFTTPFEAVPIVVATLARDVDSANAYLTVINETETEFTITASGSASGGFNWVAVGPMNSLYETLPIKIQSGKYSESAGSGTAEITFDEEFTFTPIVLASAFGSINGNTYITIQNETVSGFSALYSTLNTGFNWIAIGQ